MESGIHIRNKNIKSGFHEKKKKEKKKNPKGGGANFKNTVKKKYQLDRKFN